MLPIIDVALLFNAIFGANELAKLDRQELLSVEKEKRLLILRQSSRKDDVCFDDRRFRLSIDIAKECRMLFTDSCRIVSPSSRVSSCARSELESAAVEGSTLKFAACFAPLLFNSVVEWVLSIA